MHPSSAPARPAARIPHPSQATDERLLEAVRSGDDQAYGELYRRYEWEVRRFARSLVDADDVDDLTSETFARMLQAVRRGKGPADHPVRYLMVTARTSAVAIRRRHARQEQLRRHAGLRVVAVEELPASDRLLLAAMADLTPRWRNAVWWSIVEGASPSEIGDRTDLSPAAASALVYRAKRALREAYTTRSGQPADRAASGRELQLTAS